MVVMTATSRASLLQRWGFLEEWLLLLQKHLSYVEHQELESETLHSGLKSLCVYLPWPPKKSAVYHRKLRKLREAMELVVMMLELDRDAWHLIHDADLMCLEEFDASDYDPCDLRPRFLIKAYSSSDPGGDTIDSIAACAALLVDLEPDNPEFERARDKIMHVLDARGRLDGFRVPVSIVIGPDPMADEQVAVYMNQAETMVRAMHDLGESAGNGYPFRLTQVIFRPWEIQIRDAGGDSVQSFVECVLSLGIQLVELAVTLKDPHPQSLGRLLRSTAYRSERNRRGGTAEALMVTKNSLVAFASVCSALSTSTTFELLQLYDSFGDPEPQDASAAHHRAERWQWLGFALFSRASQSSIRELYVDEECLLLQDVQALKRTAESFEPLRTIGSSAPDDIDAAGSNPSTASARVVQLVPDAVLRLWSLDADQVELRTLAVPSVEWFPIITEDTGSEWMEILVPGYGRAFVECESVLDVATVERPLDAPRQRLTCLHLAFNHCEPGVLAIMMQTVGQSLVSLDIDTKDIQLVRAADVSAILQSCPQLKMVSLNRAKIGTLQLFTQAYEEKRCKISTLSLCNVQVSNSSLSTFAAVLADPTHPMTKTLTQFRYIYGEVEGPSETPRPDANGARAFLSMLQLNRTLSFFEVGLEPALYKKFAPKFRDLDAKLFVSHASDLPMKSKLAFLACVQVVDNGDKKRRRHAVGGVERPRLTRKLVADIFGFARPRVLRVVSATT